MNYITVVIPTYGRVELVGTLLESLAACRTHLMCESEIVVVDDSPEPEAREIEAWCARIGARFIASARRNVAFKRNLGASEARNPILLFVDSDCRADPQLLVEHVRAHEEPGADACLGMLEFEGEQPWLWLALEATPFLMSFSAARSHREVLWGPTANFSLTRAAFDAIGGFDEEFPDTPGGEDVDLGLRLNRAGFRIRCNPRAVVFHSTSTFFTLRQNLIRFFNWGKGDYHLIRRHPERVRPDLPRASVMIVASVLLGGLLALVHGSPALLSLPILAMAGALIEFGRISSAGGRHRLRDALLGLLFILANEAGTLSEGLRRRYWPILYSRMMFSNNQVLGEWVEGGLRFRSTLFGLLLSVAVLLTLKIGGWMK